MLFVDLILFTSKTKQPSEKLCHAQVLCKTNVLIQKRKSYDRISLLATVQRRNPFLTHLTPKLPSYRSLSIDLLCKSIEWFLYDDNFGV